MGLLRLFGTHEAVGGVARVDHGGTAVLGAFFSSEQEERKARIGMKKRKFMNTGKNSSPL